MTSQPRAADELGDNAQARAHGSSFYAAMRIMPPGQRDAMFEIYSFCRAVDDIADDSGPAAIRLQQLEQWRKDIALVYSGEEPPSHAGLAVSVHSFDLKQQDFLDIIDGMEMDVVQTIQAPDLATLDLYCDRVASAVGRLSVRVFGVEEQDGLRLAHHQGRALQLTNILRDLDEDAAMQRLYLPRELLSESGIETTDPTAVLAHPALAKVCNRIVEMARGHFNEADKILQRYPRRVVRTPRVMLEAYRSILNELAARGWEAPRLPVKLRKAKLGLILLRHYL